ncbi:MAG: hypothetical protein SGJ27_12790 [Candidatus Melainabacteria bacterium]|nr:hypothetical protein [Candidatus Melainabacteria bacterium]
MINRVESVFFICLCALQLGASANAASPKADRASMVQAESEYVRARKAENDGLMEGARNAYQNALNYALGANSDESYRRNIRLGGEPLGNVARRALALQKQLVDKETSSPSGKYAVKTLTNELQRMYKTMEMLEPTNPTWLYLDAVMITNRQNYIQASGILRRCINLPGGSPAVKARARTLLAHIKPAYTQQRAWLDEDWERTRKRREEYAKRPMSWDSIKPTATAGWGDPSPNWSDSSSSSSSVPSWETQAQSAERQGDYAAADRFRSGGSSMSDGQKYW